MAFNFFGLKKKPVIEDVEAKQPTAAAKPAAMTFDQALAAQAAAEGRVAESVAPVVAVETEPAPAAVVAEPVAADAPAAETEEVGQMGTMKATREDVIAAYKIFLGRLPESMEVVDPRVGVSPAALLVDFLASKEFLDQAPKAQLVLAVAKKILDERKQAQAAAEGAAPRAEAPAPTAVATSTQGQTVA